MSVTDKWSDSEAEKFTEKYIKKGINKDLAYRTYSARLLGSDPELVLHGGGNTSVKSSVEDLYCDKTDVLFVKGSGWDLATIEPEGHPATRLAPLRKMRSLKSLSDEDMVSMQRLNLLDPSSPNPSVETLLHAFLPHKFIDHTHSISLLAIADQLNSEKLCEEIYGKRVAVVPYVMPGFDLALIAANYFDKANEEAKKLNIELEGMILLKHGIFSFGDTAKQSYKRMIKLVKESENFLKRKVNLMIRNSKEENSILIQNSLIPYIRGIFCRKYKSFGENEKWVFEIRNNKNIKELLNHVDLIKITQKGVATPDHVIRTKQKPLILSLPENIDDQKSISDWIKNTENKFNAYISAYEDYFQNNNKRFGNTKIQLDPLPRLILVPEIGLIGVGKNKQSARIASDIGEAWIETLLSAEAIGEFMPVDSSETFDLEYWSLEQAKLNKKNPKILEGNVVAITGAGGVIGRSIAKEFFKYGAEIVCIDLSIEDAKETAKLCGKNSMALNCDVTDKKQLEEVFDQIIIKFGGLDILVSNAGSAWEGELSNLSDSILEKSMKLNFYSHHYVAQKSIEIFKKQDYSAESNANRLGGQLLFNISKQSLNPGKGFGSYGIPKAALLAMMKQYSLEEGAYNIRSNGVNADRIRSGLLNEKMISNRSKARGISEDDYMAGNLLKTEVKAEDVANAFVNLALMKKTTGALITVDGGNVAAMVR